VTFAPPPPRYAWPINYGGATSSQQTWAGAGQAGTQYAYANVGTSAWTIQRGNNQPSLQVGDRFQIWQTQGGGAFPTLAPWDSNAMDLFRVNQLVANDGSYSTITQTDSTVYTVQGVMYAANNSSCNIYFTPVPQYSTNNTYGVVSLPRPTQPRWLGQIAHVNGLNYSYVYPGGCDQMSFNLACEPDYRTDALNPGRIIQAFRGGSCVWEGYLLEATPTATGWQCTANGNSTYATNYVAYYPSNDWTADIPINYAINRGLRWTNPGIGSPSGIYLGPVQDSGSIMISDFLSLLCTGGTLGWNLTPPAFSTIPAGPWILSVAPMPMDVTGTLTQSPTLMLATTDPAGRTLNGTYNTICIKYEFAADKAATSTKAATSATYAYTFADIPSSVAKYGRQEYYIDASTAGLNSSDANPSPLTAAQAQQVALNILTKYVRANWGGTFTAGPNSLMNIGGTPVDLGTNLCGQVCKLVLNDAPYGGEVTMGPTEFLIGAYAYDEDSLTATITPYQAVGADIASLVSAIYPGLA
jgi:hypothetical protein